MSSLPPAPPPPWPSRWQRFSAAALRAFHAYASWLVGISWKRFFVLALLLLIAASVLQTLPPFRWTVREVISEVSEPPPLPKLPKPPTPPRPPGIAGQGDAPAPASAPKGLDVQISIDENGVRIRPRQRALAAAQAASSASAAASAVGPSIDIRLPPGATADTVREAVEEARQAIAEAIEEARRDAEDAQRDAQDAQREATEAAQGLPSPPEVLPRVRMSKVHLGDALPDLAFFWILASAIVKITYKRQIQAEVKAAQATETAEAESLKRQVVEARMAAMQAQVEPHFLFNTLASIDHLIETDPKRASVMQKNLIALLRASMPTMRETGNGGLQELGREVAVIQPYLEILKVRMEDRLETEIDVPDGLRSAEFPPMMVQSLVENAIKHGLEPKPEGGKLSVRAEIVHGRLAVTVADTGLGFGRAATAGTGIGLANIRERLQLLYGTRASLAITENPGGGTRVTITVPYTARPPEGAAT